MHTRYIRTLVRDTKIRAGVRRSAQECAEAHISVYDVSAIVFFNFFSRRDTHHVMTKTRDPCQSFTATALSTPIFNWF